MGIMDSVLGPRCDRCAQRTLNKVNGQAVCKTCETVEKAKLEATMTCPKCRTLMSKQIQQTIIYDKCGNCGGVWLDKTELESLAAVDKAIGPSSEVLMRMAIAPHS